jgi:hypothetical protein
MKVKSREIIQCSYSLLVMIQGGLGEKKSRESVGLMNGGKIENKRKYIVTHAGSKKKKKTNASPYKDSFVS